MEEKYLIMLTYRPEDHNYDWKMDNEIDVYTNDPHKTKDLPKPQAPTGEAILTLSSKDIAHRLQSIDTSDKATIQSVVMKLIDPFSSNNLTDADKVCLLYYWLTAQDLRRRSFLLTANFKTVTYQLWKLKHKENSYAALFMLLCGLAEIPCVIIRGLLKSGPDKIGEGEWNAVLVDGTWRLVDTFWGSNSVPSLYPVRHYLFPDPKQFQYSHWAESPQWQLAPPISRQTFKNQACLTEKFFRMNMAVLQNNDTNLTATNGEVEIMFALNAEDTTDQVFQCFQYACTSNKIKQIYPSHGKQMDFIYKKPELQTANDNSFLLGIKVRFENPGAYQLEIVGETRQETEDLVAVYKVDVENTPQNVCLFPEIDKKGWGPSFYTDRYGLKAKSHLYSIIKSKSASVKIEFEVTNPKHADNVKLMYKLQEIDGDIFLEDPEGGYREGLVVSIQVNLAGLGDCRLTISAVLGGNHIENICSYYIDTSELLANDQYKEMVQVLKSAIKQRSAEKLKDATDQVREAGYANHIKVNGLYKTAHNLYLQLRNYENSIAQIRGITKQTVLILKSFNAPETAIVKVMKATFLILGTPAKQLTTWEAIKAEITSIGNNNLQRRVSSLEIGQLDGRIVHEAEHEMAGINAVMSTDTSEHVASFAKWLESVFSTYRALNSKFDDDDDENDL